MSHFVYSSLQVVIDEVVIPSLDEFGEYSGGFDLKAIAKEITVRDGKGYVLLDENDDPNVYWEIVEKHEI